MAKFLCLKSFREENAFIVTCYPSQDDDVDFLRLLIDYDSDTIICMDPLADIESVCHSYFF